MTRPLSDLPPFIYGTTRLGHDDVPRERQAAMAQAALDAGLWLHTSRQYDHALEVLGEAFCRLLETLDPERLPTSGGMSCSVPCRPGHC